ncbi:MULTISPECIES: LacI family DNA-binding transcriptional regulator [Subtercola]|uniref:LacI family transcriptional regulator n=1 Tax=Subtercola vilae TaxID=2056433 RepID=A0A4V4RFR0_9MICO|nr:MULTISPECIES: LacI family DNA-binding transcriptional regulator [Subtercola]MEA9984114.1 LacI family DNA-binding transcriptional regulator [Subtercola sp. RTI3]TIH38734.1 LacI family transcriptional regulator [Subtercola vilae]
MSRTFAKPASIADVARVAGVSVPTVSRVLTGAAKVSAERRERVQRAIVELGYRPNSAARALVSGKQTIIAVMTSDTTIYGYSATIEGIEVAAREAGFFVVISVIEFSDAAEVDRAVSLALGQPLAGIIVLKFDPAGVQILKSLPRDIPLVAVSGELDDSLSQAVLDEEAAGAEMTRYLLGLGHATVHHVSIPPSRKEDGRTIGWRKALAEAGAETPPIISASWAADSGVRIGLGLAARPDITAVFCGNDEVAMGVIAGVVDSGRRVPDDVSVVGFDDHPLSRIWRPGITTAMQDFGSLGKRAFSLLALQIEGEESPARSSERPPLVIRASAAPPPRR